MRPASMSPWVTDFVAVQVIETPGASDVAGQAIAPRPGNGSVIVMPVSVTLPVLVTTNE